MVPGDRFTGNAIFAFDPPTQIYQLATFATERAKGIFFPFGRLAAGWTLHAFRRAPLLLNERSGPFDQYSSFDECDRTFAAHGIQADCDTFAGRANNGGNFSMR